MNLTINDFNSIVNKKTPFSIVIFIIILIVLFVSLFLVIIKYEYYKYDEYLGYISKENEFYISIYVEEEKLQVFNDSSLEIDKEKLTIFKKTISDDYYLIDGKPYRLVNLYTDLKEEYLIVNNVISIKSKTYETTIFKEIKKGLDLWN